MIQNSLDRLFAGVIETLRSEVLPATHDDFARTQLSASIEILANLATRVEWNREQLRDTTARALAALAAAAAAAPALAPFATHATATQDPLDQRNDALGRVSGAIRACDHLHADVGDAAIEPLREFCVWHVERELELLRTGMFSG